ncbi:hypothetical protein TMatcc_007570 [Talaromyces marneffei ATCC 18224]
MDISRQEIDEEIEGLALAEDLTKRERWDQTFKRTVGIYEVGGLHYCPNKSKGESPNKTLC